MTGRDLHLYNEIVETTNEGGNTFIEAQDMVVTTAAAEMELQDFTSGRGSQAGF